MELTEPLEAAVVKADQVEEEAIPKRLLALHVAARPGRRSSRY